MSRFTIAAIRSTGMGGWSGQAHLLAREEADEDGAMADLAREVLAKAVGGDEHGRVA